MEKNSYETPITSLESGNSDLISFFKQATSPIVVKNEPNKSQEDSNHSSLNIYQGSMNLDNSSYQPLSFNNNDDHHQENEEEEDQFQFKVPSFVVNKETDQITFSIEKNNNNSNSIIGDESYISISLPIFDAVTSQDPKLLFQRDGQKQRRKRGITIPDSKKKLDEITLDDLMKTDFLRIGDRLTYTIAGTTFTGILLRGGYIESLEESFPSVHSWIVKVLSYLKQNTRYHWFSPYDAIFIRGKSLNFIRSLFESKYYKNKDNVIIKKEQTEEEEEEEDRSELSRKRVLEYQKPFSQPKKLKLENNNNVSPTKIINNEHSSSQEKSPSVILRNYKNVKEDEPTQMNIDEPTLPLPDNHIINLSADSFKSVDEDDLPTLPVNGGDVNLSNESFGGMEVNKGNNSVQDDDTTLSASLTDQPKTYISPIKAVKLSPSHSQNTNNNNNNNNNKTPPKQSQTQSQQISQNNKTPVQQSFDSNKFKTPSPINSQYQSQPLYQISQLQNIKSQSSSNPPSQQSMVSSLSSQSSQSQQLSQHFEQISQPSQQFSPKHLSKQPTSQKQLSQHFEQISQPSQQEQYSQQHLEQISQKQPSQHEQNSQQHLEQISQKSSHSTIYSNKSSQSNYNNNIISLETNVFKTPSQKKSSHRISPQVSISEIPLSQEEIEDSIHLPISKTKEPVILATGVNNLMKLHILSLTNALGGKLVDSLTDEVTHIVCSTFDENGKRITKRTLKYQMGLLKGSIWIVAFDWILESLIENKWLNEEEFEIQGDNIALGSPFKSRHLLSTSTRLFYGYSFYLAGEFSSPSKEELSSLIIESGGILLTTKPPRPHNIKELLESKCFVLSSPTLTPEKSKEIYLDTKHYPISFHFILDSISNYQVLKHEKYILNLNHQFLNLNDDIQSITF